MNQQILVLNSDYSPLNLVSVRRGFNLVNNGKAEVLKEDTENPIVTGYKTFVRPIIVRLYRYVSFKYKQARVNRHKIYKRDGHTCAYCGATKHLTIDHVTPKSRGGDNGWENLVTCCLRCNLKKADRTPEEAGMALKKKPYQPSVATEMLSTPMGKIWLDFQSNYN